MYDPSPIPRARIPRARIPRIAALLGLTVTLALPATALELETEDARIQYAMGRSIGELVEQAYFLAPGEHERVLAGIRDVLEGRPSRVADEAHYRGEFGRYKRRRFDADMERRQAEFATAQRTFIEDMAAQPGARVSPSGMVYLEREAGDGPAPGPGDRVVLHFRGTLADGTVFDDSQARGVPTTFTLGRVISCWEEGLPRMRAGGRATLVCPARLAYGHGPAPKGVPPGAALRYDIEMLEVKPAAAEVTAGP